MSSILLLIRWFEPVCKLNCSKLNLLNIHKLKLWSTCLKNKFCQKKLKEQNTEKHYEIQFDDFAWFANEIWEENIYKRMIFTKVLGLLTFWQHNFKYPNKSAAFQLLLTQFLAKKWSWLLQKLSDFCDSNFAIHKIFHPIRWFHPICQFIQNAFFLPIID